MTSLLKGIFCHRHSRFPSCTAFVFLTLGLITHTPTWAAPHKEKKTMRIFYLNNFPPFQFANENGEPDGLDVEMMRNAMQRLNQPYVEIMGARHEAKKLLREKKIDLLPRTSYSVADSSYFTFGPIMSYCYIAMIVPQGSMLRTRDDIVGRTVAIIRYSPVDNQFTLHPPHFTFVRCNTFEEMMEKLSNEQVDAALCNLITARFKMHNEPKYKNYLVFSSYMQPSAYQMATYKGNEKFLLDVDSVLFNMRRTGENDDLSTKWDNKSLDVNTDIYLYIILALIVWCMLLAAAVMLIKGSQSKVKTLNNEKKDKMLNDVFNNFTELIYCMPVPIVVRDMVSKNAPYIYRNKAAVDMGYGTEKLKFHVKGLDERQTLKRILESDRQAFEQNLHITNMETLVTSNGATDDVLVTRFPTAYYGKRCVLTVFNGVSAVMDKQRKLILEKNAAEASNRLKATFIANLNHEIRTPLNAIIGFSNMMQATDNQTEKEEYMRIVNTNLQYLLRIINDMLDYSQIENGEMKLYKTTFDMHNTIEQIFVFMREFNLNSQLELKLESPYKQCLIENDEKRVEQIGLNFVTNALKFTHSGSITLGYEYVDNGIRIYVKDTGVGIQPGPHDRIFKRFYKGDGIHVQGNGLGLSICKAVIKEMNGKMDYDSIEGVGSTFWAWFPCEAKIQ